MPYMRRVFYFDQAGNKHVVFRSMGDVYDRALGADVLEQTGDADPDIMSGLLTIGALGALYLILRRKLK